MTLPKYARLPRRYRLEVHYWVDLQNVCFHSLGSIIETRELHQYLVSTLYILYTDRSGTVKATKRKYLDKTYLTPLQQKSNRDWRNVPYNRKRIIKIRGTK